MKKKVADSRVRRVVMVGPFPPPTTGMALVNKVVRDSIGQLLPRPIVINLSPRGLDRSLLVRMRRAPTVAWGLLRLCRMGHVRLYMSVSGGLGQLYEMAFLIIARIRGMPVYLHHHTFAYLDARRCVTILLTRLAGEGATHIALSREMARRLKALYGVRNTLEISNVVYVRSLSPLTRSRNRSCLRVLAFLSNVSEEKGVFDFLDIMKAVQDEGLPLNGVLAGPFQDVKTEQRVRARVAQSSNVEYVGAKYGTEKDMFFESADALIFPTQYRNEAEPLIIHEAMNHGLPIVAYGRGAIPEIVGDDCGKVIDTDSPFVPEAMRHIRAWLDKPRTFEKASWGAKARFDDGCVKNNGRWRTLLAEVSGDSAARSLADLPVAPCVSHHQSGEDRSRSAK